MFFMECKYHPDNIVENENENALRDTRTKLCNEYRITHIQKLFQLTNFFLKKKKENENEIQKALTSKLIANSLNIARNIQ